MSRLDRVLQQIEAGNYESTEQGFLVPSENTVVSGIVSYCKRGEEEDITHNLIVGQGLNYLLDTALKGATPSSTWYIALFSGDVTVQGTWTAANFASNATEVTAYAATARPAWNGGSVSGGSVDSFSAKSEFEASSNGVVVRGAALISSATKGGTSGTLLGATRFPTSKNLDTGEILDVGYGVQLTAAT